MNNSKKGESITHSENENGSVKANIEGSDKQKFALYITPQSMDTVNMLYKSDNCSSRSEFIEKAVKFYTGYICASKSVNYISPLLTSMPQSFQNSGGAWKTVAYDRRGK